MKDTKREMEAMRSTKGGVLLDVEVSPSAKSTEVPSGYDVWRKRIVVRVASAPTGGKANAELVKQLAARLNVHPSSVRIVSGHKSTKKTIMVDGIEPADAYAALFGR